MTKPQVGDRIRVVPQTFGNQLVLGIPKNGQGVDERRREAFPGTVTYVHPTGRWFQVTFDIGIKECFFWC